MPGAAALGLPTDRVRNSDVEQTWFKLVQALDKKEPETARERLEELMVLAGKLDLWRMPQHALALTARASTLAPAEAESLLVYATRLDPASAEAWASLAAVRFKRLRLGSGTAATVSAISSLVGDQRLRVSVVPSALLSLLTGSLIGFSLWAALAIGHVASRLWHDAGELASHLRLGSNGPVLAVFIFALPLFAGGDPFWAILWVLALCWAYLTPGRKVLMAAGMLLVAMTPTLTELSFRDLAHPPGIVEEASYALTDHRYEPALIDELAALSDLFGEEPLYHRLMGDCYRQFGLLDTAVWAYREGLRSAPQNGSIAMSLGVVMYMQGDYNAALQAFQAARDNGFNSALANYNLSLAFAQTYHFRESEEAMAAASKADPAGIQAMTRSKAHQLFVPPFTLEDAHRLLGRKDSILLLNRGLLPAPLRWERTLTHPLALGGMLALVVAIMHFLLRQKTTGFATACAKCGRPFCARCKLARESQTYCTQCVNIFLKKDMVPIEAQMAKRRQLVRRQATQRVIYRVADAIMPGLGLAYSGRPVLGVLLTFFVIIIGSAVAIWLPFFVRQLLMHGAIWPLATTGGILWAGIVVLAQVTPGRR
jgi:hypothetical protein